MGHVVWRRKVLCGESEAGGNISARWSFFFFYTRYCAWLPQAGLARQIIHFPVQDLRIYVFGLF